MNSKKIALLLITLSAGACGVKAPPVKYPETVVESYIQSYTGGDPSPEELARIKKEQEAEARAKAEEEASNPLSLPTSTK